ncbi:putative disease resistance protein [Glycine soja]
MAAFASSTSITDHIDAVIVKLTFDQFHFIATQNSMSTKLDKILQRLTLLEIHYQFSNVLLPSSIPSFEKPVAGVVPQSNTEDRAAKFESSFMEESLNSKPVFRRGYGFGNHDCTMFHRHMPFKLDHSDSEDTNVVSFEVMKENPFWVYDREALRLFRKLGKGYFRDRILFLTVLQSPNVEQLRTNIWGYIIGNERLDANYVVPQWMPQFECRSEAQTLIVLDDVWTLFVVNQLVCRIPGCKFLVVSRPKFQMVLSYEVELLIEDDAMYFFCHHAFGQKSIPLAINENLVKQVVIECGRFPLALKVIGASLRDQIEMFWLSVRNRISHGSSIGESHEINLIDKMTISINYLLEKIKECYLDLC